MSKELCRMNCCRYPRSSFSVPQASLKNGLTLTHYYKVHLGEEKLTMRLGNVENFELWWRPSHSEFWGILLYTDRWLTRMFARAVSKSEHRMRGAYENSAHTRLRRVRWYNTVDPHGRENLIAVADEIISSVSRVPAGNQYRVNVEKWFSYMKKVANDSSDIRKIETKSRWGRSRRSCPWPRMNWN